MTYSGPDEVGAGVSVSFQSESAEGKTKSRIVVVDAVNMVGVSVPKESTSTTASEEVVMTESTIPSTAVSLIYKILMTCHTTLSQRVAKSGERQRILDNIEETIKLCSGKVGPPPSPCHHDPIAERREPTQIYVQT